MMVTEVKNTEGSQGSSAETNGGTHHVLHGSGAGCDSVGFDLTESKRQSDELKAMVDRMLETSVGVGTELVVFTRLVKLTQTMIREIENLKMPPMPPLSPDVQPERLCTPA